MGQFAASREENNDDDDDNEGENHNHNNYNENEDDDEIEKEEAEAISTSRRSWAGRWCAARGGGSMLPSPDADKNGGKGVAADDGNDLDGPGGGGGMDYSNSDLGL